LILKGNYTIGGTLPKKIDAQLVKELKVSQVELDALWTFVKKNSLRQRALLWRGKFGSALPLPNNTV
jgi:hypothetical protein